MFSLLSLLPAFIACGALASQQVIETNFFDQVNFTTLFAPSSFVDHKSGAATVWDTKTWGLTSYARTEPLRCFGNDGGALYDVAVIGAPFDTTTSYRPGARFGPNGIRQGSRRLSVGSMNVPMKTRISDHLRVVDCGDIPMVYTDNKVALRQLDIANAALVSRESLRSSAQLASGLKSLAKDGKFHPRVLTLGGDHTIALPLLRGVAAIYGPVSVIHFDSHLDSRRPKSPPDSPWNPDEEMPVSHGSYFWYAYQEGLLASDNRNIHVGIRNQLYDQPLLDQDAEIGFQIAFAEDIVDVGYKGIVDRIREVVGDNPVYITFDIDVIDPAFAPATGTPEIGGFTTREIKKILHGLSGLKIVGADIVEVAPAYDFQAENTQVVAANIGWEFLTLMAQTPLTV